MGPVIIDERGCAGSEQSEFLFHGLRIVVDAASSVASAVLGDALEDNVGGAIEHKHGLEVDEAGHGLGLAYVTRQTVQDEQVGIGDGGGCDNREQDVLGNVKLVVFQQRACVKHVSDNRDVGVGELWVAVRGAGCGAELIAEIKMDATSGAEAVVLKVLAQGCLAGAGWAE